MNLNQNQIAAISHVDHAVVLACPGSGKSTVIELKIEHTLSIISQSQIIALSFTNKSADKAKKKILSKLTKEKAKRVKVGTFHSIAFRQLKTVRPHLKIVTGGQVRQLIQRAIEISKIDIELDDAVKQIETLRANPDHAISDESIRYLYQQYDNLLSRNNLIDFGGILILAVRLMRRGELPLLPCTHLFCDECQDVDKVQLVWCMEYARRGAVIFFVGDDDQSIYRFRFAMGLHGLLMPHHYYGAKIITLDINYRCRSEIVSVASQLIAHNKGRVRKNFQASRGEGGLIKTFEFADAAKEANRIAKIIKDSCSGNFNPDPERYSVGVREGQWAVLARNNHDLVEISMAMTANGIPIIQKTENPWSQEPVCFVTGLLGALTTFDGTGFDGALFFAGITQQNLERCNQIFAEEPILFIDYSKPEHFREFDPSTADIFMQFISQVRGWRNDLESDRIRRVVSQVVRWFMVVLAERGKLDGKKYSKEKRLLKSAMKILVAMQGTLPQRLNRIRINSENKKDEGAPGVFLDTMHASKGLEFENVWLAHLNDDVIPSIKDDSIEHIEEERRLLYVGATRPKESLYASYVGSASQFFYEAGFDRFMNRR